MSGYIGKFVTAVSAALEFNSATLSGAIDIIVIEDDNGRRQCSPFYVRFGKLQLLKSRGMPVDVELNDTKTDLRMYLGAAGEAYFYDSSLADKLQTTSGYNPFLTAAPSAETEQKGLDSGAAPAEALSSLPHSVEAGTCEATELPSPPERSAGDAPDNVACAVEHSFTHQFETSVSLPVPLAAPVQSDEEFYTRAIRSTSDLGFQNFGYMSDSEMELTRGERDGTTEVVHEPRSPPVSDPQRRWTTQWTRGRSALQRQTNSNPNESSSCASLEEQADAGDTEKDQLSVVSARPNEDQNSSLYGLPGPQETNEIHQTFDGQDYGSGASGSNMAGAIESNESKYNSEQLVEKDEVALGNGDRAGIERGWSHPHTTQMHDPDAVITLPVGNAEVDLDEDSKLDLRSLDGFDEPTDLVPQGIEEKLAEVLGKDPELEPGSLLTPDSESRFDEDESGAEGVIDMSLCGAALGEGMSEEDMMAVFEMCRVSHEQFVADPNILYDKSLVFRIEDRLVDFRVAAPFVMAMLAFKTPMDIDMLSKMMAQPVAEEPPKAASSPPRRFGWFGWSSPAVEGEPLLGKEDLDAIASENVERSLNVDAIPTGPSSKLTQTNAENPVSTIDSEAFLLPPGVDAPVVAEKQEAQLAEEQDESTFDAFSKQQSDALEGAGTSAVSGNIGQAQISLEEAVFSEADYDSECFSFLPTCAQLEKLDLKPGANEIRFIASETVELRCRVFLWRNDSKIVISDVDGTITRSDVLGHLLPAVGRDWSHVGVAGLYSQIAKNGYKMLYLTARPIGQASQTRDFLHSVAQGTARLPNGPVLMSPSRLVESFTREVIRRKPHEFKIACLRDVRCLFPPTYNPFHAGFGNRDTDVISYRAVGLIPQRIFVVNPRGELVVMKAAYESTASYSSLRTLVENVFPDISGKSGQEYIRQVTESATYNDWNYWRGSLPEVDLDALLGITPVLPTT